MTRRPCNIAVIGYRLSGLRSGAHMALMELAGFLADRGHHVAYAARIGEPETRHGRPVHVGRAALTRAIAAADVILCRDEPKIMRVLRYARGKRIIYTCHSPAGAPCELDVPLPTNSVVVCVSQALKDAIVARHGRAARKYAVIEGNPMDLSRYRTPPGERITLINLSERKGGPLFWRLAELMPERRFLGVRGWGPQIVPDVIPPNVEMWERVSDPRAIYAQTRILLIPSAEAGTVRSAHLPAWGESWNRVGVEAAASGIPAIAHPARGIVASMGRAARYVDREDTQGWVNAINDLDDDAFYHRCWFTARNHADEVQARFVGIMDQYEALLVSGAEHSSAAGVYRHLAGLTGAR
jgi:glycosyltransferase involved in cell wall biosynthesis